MTPTKEADAKREHRRTQVIANVLAGVAYRDIATGLDCSASTVARDVKAILGRWQQEQEWIGSLYANLELRRLDVAVAAIWAKVQKGELQAIDRLLAIMDRRAKYLRLYVPFEVKLTDDELTQEIQKLLAEIASLGPGAAAAKAAALVAELGVSSAVDLGEG
jgi:hypothetical protein